MAGKVVWRPPATCPSEGVWLAARVPRASETVIHTGVLVSHAESRRSHSGVSPTPAGDLRLTARGTRETARDGLGATPASPPAVSDFLRQLQGPPCCFT